MASTAVPALRRLTAMISSGPEWFITTYIAVYMQGLYTVYNGAGVQGTVAVLELAGNQGRRQPPHYFDFNISLHFKPHSIA
jgi:hypothetical protein